MTELLFKQFFRTKTDIFPKKKKDQSVFIVIEIDNSVVCKCIQSILGVIYACETLTSFKQKLQFVSNIRLT